MCSGVVVEGQRSQPGGGIPFGFYNPIPTFPNQATFGEPIEQAPPPERLPEIPVQAQRTRATPAQLQPTLPEVTVSATPILAGVPKPSAPPPKPRPKPRRTAPPPKTRPRRPVK